MVDSCFIVPYTMRKRMLSGPSDMYRRNALLGAIGIYTGMHFRGAEVAGLIASSTGLVSKFVRIEELLSTRQLFERKNIDERVLRSQFLANKVEVKEGSNGSVLVVLYDFDESDIEAIDRLALKNAEVRVTLARDETPVTVIIHFTLRSDANSIKLRTLREIFSAEFTRVDELKLQPGRIFSNLTDHDGNAEFTSTLYEPSGNVSLHVSTFGDGSLYTFHATKTEEK